LAEELGVDVVWRIGYQPLDRFVGAIAAADVVVCPYDVASQSAVLAQARQVGTVSVASAVGGLPELAHEVFPPGDADGLSQALRRALRRAPPSAAEQRSTADAYLAVDGR
jgi:glycosyltransferase involved in cell wall biosynthesis